MKKNEKTLMYTALGLGVVLGAFFYFKKDKNSAKLRGNISDDNKDDSDKYTSDVMPDDSDKYTSDVMPDDSDKYTSDVMPDEYDPNEYNFPLLKGSKGSEVLALQQYINRSPMCRDKMPKSAPNIRVRKVLPLDEDGIFGELTEMAVESCYGTKSIEESLWRKINGALPNLSM